ncbi:Outer membrane receptor for ferrienterochelin and colicins [Mucilaginibacter pineti]|uniref:Outer membrane receptor for ferrienterochelin and colicins n=1 Tax=Mucilaginibacter pineti TaxID=1391627 RepID=A0A1G7J670_9SPHI|nr:TonB-dependent receptor [Mucilaginibacter pineti]SDF20365.1 Outer membrane receptor for ferrienterochelin and colicins [Mucilaginibacter pineti]
MKLIYILFLSVIFSVNVHAQGTGGKGKITGKVTDAATKQPVDYATVAIYKQGVAAPFNGISTDPKGGFILDKIPAGEYKITVDFLGYQRTTIEHVLVKDGGNTTLNDILLAPVPHQLKGVTITATTPTVENKIDKMVYNPQNDLSAQGGVAIDILKKVPQITVDIDGNVELQGNANIRFLINGKPSSIFGASLADALASIPASQIKSIEVVTSPGAKYDAAGTGGIINIILKDSRVEGVNGSINLSAGTRRENGSFNLNVRKGNFGVNAFFSGNAQINTNSPNSRTRNSTDSALNRTTLLQDGSNNFKRNGYESGINFTWNISKHDDLTAGVGFNHFGNHGEGVTNQDQSVFNVAGQQLSNLQSIRNSSSKFNGTATDVNLNYKKTFDTEGQELNILYSSSFGNNSFSSFQQQNYFTAGIPSTGIRNNNPGKDHETNISVDYTQPLSKDFTIETGGKLVFDHINNNVITDSLAGSTFVPNAGQTYGFTYDRKIYAYYLSASTSLFNKFLDVKAGLRDEYTSTNADFQGVTIPGYNTLAPSLVFQHKLDASQSIKLSYTRRIERPEYGDLNPFLNISDPHNISTGNPQLKPELGDNFELGYNKSYDKGANINIAAFYRRNTDDIQSFTTFYSQLDINGTTYTDVSLNQRYNLGSEVRTGVNLYGSVPVTKEFNLRSNMIFSDRISNNPGSPSVSGFAYRLNLNAQYSFGHDLSAEFFGNYNSSQKGIQGVNPKFVFYNFAMRKQFLNKKASFGLTASNPFSKYVGQRSTTFGSNFNQVNIRNIPVQSFGISLSYKFGKLDFKKDNEKDDKEPGNREESAPADKGR